MRTFLAVYIADLPEQQNVAGVTSGYAPSSTAGPTTLGRSTPQPLRRGKDTLDAIKAINEEIEALGAQGDLERYRKIAKAYGLNGVDLLFWRNWLWAEPPFFLAPDALHQLHKLFIDHLVNWARQLLGAEEFDRRLSMLQPRIGARHFRSGFFRYKQHTGSDAKHLESVFLVLIAGHERVTEGILSAVRAFLDVVYLAQYDSHSTETLRYLREKLEEFHDNLNEVSASGVRNGARQNGEFNIPKFELLQHVERLVKLLGSALQYSSEQTERCHKDIPKVTFFFLSFFLSFLLIVYSWHLRSLTRPRISRAHSWSKCSDSWIEWRKCGSSPSLSSWAVLQSMAWSESFRNCLGYTFPLLSGTFSRARIRYAVTRRHFDSAKDPTIRMFQSPMRNGNMSCRAYGKTSAVISLVPGLIQTPIFRLTLLTRGSV